MVDNNIHMPHDYNEKHVRDIAGDSSVLCGSDSSHSIACYPDLERPSSSSELLLLEAAWSPWSLLVMYVCNGKAASWLATVAEIAQCSLVCQLSDRVLHRPGVVVVGVVGGWVRAAIGSGARSV